MEEKRGAVLVCPLNWGLGHASRCIPLVMELIKQNQEVIIAADGGPLRLLKTEFPELQFIELKGANIRYSEKGFSVFMMLTQFPKMIWGVYSEHCWLKEILKRNNIIAIISDNRYGLWSSGIKSIIITHQLNIQLPHFWKWMEYGVNKLNRFLIAKFNECWVPDEKEHINISGDLSHNCKSVKNVKYIGMLSRMNTVSENSQDKIYEVLAILSGPEPQRSVLENIVISKLSNKDKNVLIVRGLPDMNEAPATNGNITLVNHLPASLLKAHMMKCRFIICRSGYSSLMDLAAIGRSAIVIPTPGQPEQEYLAKYHHQSCHHFMLQQDTLDLDTAYSGISNCKPILLRNNNLEILVSDFLINRTGIRY